MLLGCSSASLEGGSALEEQESSSDSVSMEMTQARQSSQQQRTGGSHQGHSFAKNSKKMLQEENLEKESSNATSQSGDSHGKTTVLAQSEIQHWIRSENWKALEEYALSRLQQNPKDIRLLNILGLAYYYEKKPLLARYYLRKALEVSPKNGAVLNNLGLVSRLEGNNRESISFWRQALEGRESSSLSAQSNLVTEFAKAKDYKKLRDLGDRIDGRKSKNIVMLVNLGIGYMASGQYPMAEKLYSQAFSLDESNPVTLLNYAILNVEHGHNLDLGRRQLDRLGFLGVQSDMQETLNRLEKKFENVKGQ
jgi:Flp pilus assembly protein TadD